MSDPIPDIFGPNPITIVSPDGTITIVDLFLPPKDGDGEEPEEDGGLEGVQ
jgi:hypothetical protein